MIDHKDLCILRPAFRSISYGFGLVSADLDMNLEFGLSHEANLGLKDRCRTANCKFLSSMGSGLEAFSHNPTSGSFAAPSDRATANARDLK